MYSECTCETVVTVGTRKEKPSPIQLALQREPRECLKCPIGNKSPIVCADHITAENVCTSYLVEYWNYCTHITWSHEHRYQSFVKCPVDYKCKLVRNEYFLYFVGLYDS